MVTIKERKIAGKTYYYLKHSYREKGKLKYRETYIGNRIPTYIEQLKKDFLLEIYKDKWFNQFEKIKKAYSKRQKALPLEIIDKELEDFAIQFTYDTNRIEGSRLSFNDTKELLERGISPKGKPVRDIKEAEAHRKVFYEMIRHGGQLSVGIMLKWHKELFAATKPGIAGVIRTYDVYISNSKHIPPRPEEVQSYLLELFRWYSRESSRMNPIELAARLHVRFETIHPFGDGNGRIGRLMMNFVLHKNGYPMSDIKYTNRRGYYNALEKSNVKRDETIFVQWFFRNYLKENLRYLKT